MSPSTSDVLISSTLIPDSIIDVSTGFFLP